MALGNRLKQILDERNITVKDFAEKIGVPATTLYSFIKRDSMDAKLDLLLKICDGLNMPLDVFLARQVQLPFNDGGTTNIVDLTYLDDKDAIQAAAMLGMLHDGCIKVTGSKIDTNDYVYFDSEEYTPEELNKIKEYAEFLKSQRNK